MSRIIALTGATSINNVQVKQSTAILSFECGFPDAQAADWATLLTRMNAITVDVDLQNKLGKTENLIPKIPLGKLAEMAVADGGQINVTDNGADMDVKFKVEIGVSGALSLGEETAIVVGVNGMVANDRVNVNAIDFPLASNAAKKINVIRFSANAAQSVSLVNSSTIHLPVSSFEKIELTYRGGKVITLTKAEVEAWVLEGNGVQGNLLGVITDGFIQLYSLAVHDAISAKVTQTADVNGYLTTYVAAL